MTIRKSRDRMSPELLAAAYHFALSVIARQTGTSEQSAKLIELANDTIQYFPPGQVSVYGLASMADYVAEHFPATVANE